jgi:hypothetical protein
MLDRPRVWGHFGRFGLVSLLFLGIGRSVFRIKDNLTIGIDFHFPPPPVVAQDCIPKLFQPSIICHGFTSFAFIRFSEENPSRQ